MLGTSGRSELCSRILGLYVLAREQGAVPGDELYRAGGRGSVRATCNKEHDFSSMLHIASPTRLNRLLTLFRGAVGKAQ